MSVTVTAPDPDKEPSDAKVPLADPRDALRDYELSVVDDLGATWPLGVKPNESAAAGLTWKLASPISISQVASVQLREKDMVISENLAVVHVQAASAESKGYRFEFETERSIGVGVQAFFRTPLGVAILVGFVLAVVGLVLAIFSQ